MRIWVVGGLMFLGVSAAVLWLYQGADNGNSKSMEAEMLDVTFFESPESAVEAIKVMLNEEDWASLARYYDLGNSDIDRASLVSGEFFVRTERPEVSHPGEFWRYKHPFPPSFEYSFASPADESGIVIVRVGITIDQGAGQPAQEGWQEFRMKESPAGYQVLPG